MHETSCQILQIQKKCRYKERCAYKHDTISQQNDYNFEIKNLQNKIKDLVECQKKSDEKIEYLEKEIKSMKNKKAKKEKVTSPSEECKSKAEKLKQDFNIFKSEFELFKMCHSNQPSKITQIELPVTRSNTFKCKLCDLEFMTENGQKVQGTLNIKS